MRSQIRKINIRITKIRKSVELSKVFASAKWRQRLDNDTRWGSTFLMLEQIVKAEQKNLLDEIKDECPCPISLAVIKNYLAILKPAYFFNIGLQRQSTSIAEIIPSVTKCISEWDFIKEKTSSSGKQLCELLISEFKTRFDYELKSHLYLVSFQKKCRVKRGLMKHISLFSIYFFYYSCWKFNFCTVQKLIKSYIRICFKILIFVII